MRGEGRIFKRGVPPSGRNAFPTKPSRPISAPCRRRSCAARIWPSSSAGSAPSTSRPSGSARTRPRDWRRAPPARRL